jgi:transcription termination/antitermination protein NusG
MSEETVVTDTPEVTAPDTKWYVLRVISGKERKVKEYLDKDIARNGWDKNVVQVLLPMEKIYKVQAGKKVVRERNQYPGYIMIEVFKRAYTQYNGCDSFLR